MNLKKIDVILTEDGLFLKTGKCWIKVLYDAILFLEVRNTHTCFHLSEGQAITVRASLSHLLEVLPKALFCQTNRRYAVNVRHVQKISSESIFLTENTLPLSRSRRATLLSQLV